MDFVDDLVLHNAIDSFKVHFELMNDCRHSVAKKLGISDREARILIALSDNPAVDTASAISRLSGVSKAYISKGVEALLKKNLISANRDENDRRVQHLKLLPEAEQYTVPLVQCGLKLINELLAGTTEEERKQTAKLFEKMTENAVRIKSIDE